jgi:glycerophosphoryl diester phosphodiesterase
MASRRPMHRALAALGGALAVALALPAAAFDLQGHRGARGHAPENTVASFERALAIGVDTLECDLAITRDGVVVVYHDLWLNPDITRGPDGEWLAARGPAIHALTWKELQAYDVGRIKPGTKYAAEFPDQQPRDGERIPRLADVFDLVRRSGNDKVRFDCETKLSPLEPGATLPPEAFAKRVIEEVRKLGMAARMTIQSFDWRTLQVVQKEAPEIRTLYLSSPRTLQAAPGGGPSPWLAGFALESHGGSVARAVHAAGGRYWAPNQTYVTPERLAEARALGIEVIPYTVNDPAMIEKLLDMGVDGLITDYPDRVRGALARRSASSPAR